MKCISQGSVAKVFSTDPLSPVGISSTLDGHLLITLKDSESKLYQPNSRSRRLVRRMSLKGNVIREYEFQKGGKMGLFTVPCRVLENLNTDVCVINATSDSTGELVILSFSGSLKTVYPEQDQRDNFKFTDVVCDPQSNIIVSES
ncbi:uncharacterized protein LOC144619208 [Crassostrea virginica]